MAKLIDTLSWYNNGEKANATVLNRPLKELVNLFDTNQFNALSKTQGKSVDLDDLDGVQDGDFIYLSSDGKYRPALADGTDKENVVGVYKLINDEHTIIFGGLISGVYDSSETYFLSPTSPGTLTTDETLLTPKIGVGISETELLLSFGGGSSSADKEKLANTEVTSQLDARDIANRARGNHTGTQPISTIINLQSELNSKVNISSIVDNLTSTLNDVPLSANQGRVLKGLIDTINDVLSSDDTSLDELQEIVDFIKLNREDLDSLSISSIAGLETALSNKQPLDGDLTSIAGITGTSGILRKTASNTWSLDTTNYATSSGVTSVSGTAPISSSGGSTPSISISNATTTAAGAMSAADKTKLNGIATGAQVNVGTNLGQGTRTTTTVPITSSTGTNATLSAASTTLAGVMTSADKSKLNGIAAGANNYVHPTTDGNLHVPATGTTSNGKVLTAGAIAGSLSWSVLPTATETVSGVVSTTSQTFAGDKTFTGTITETSDGRLKENVLRLTDSLSKILNLNGVQFNKIGSETTEIGFIAQEVQSVVPEIVTSNEDGMLSVSYARTVALLVEAMKEQNEKFTSEIASLKEEIENLKR